VKPRSGSRLQRFFEDRLVDVFRERVPDDCFALDRRRLDARVFAPRFGGGALAPFSRASLNPIAIACLRPRTVRPEPLLSVPFFCRRTADSTLFDAALPYFAISHLLVPLDTRTRSPGDHDHETSSPRDLET
jgi:hypothetical protein